MTYVEQDLLTNIWSEINSAITDAERNTFDDFHVVLEFNSNIQKWLKQIDRCTELVSSNSNLVNNLSELWFSMNNDNDNDNDNDYADDDKYNNMDIASNYQNHADQWETILENIIKQYPVKK